MTRLPLLRQLRPLAWVLVLGMAATGALAGTTTIGVELDTDNNPATGCVQSATEAAA